MNKSDSDRDQYWRWRLSLHESAHVVTGTVLAQRRNIPPLPPFACLLPDIGLSHAGYKGMKEIHNIDGAIYAAAGRIGERLTSRYKPPRLQKKEPPTPITPTNPPAGMKRETFKAVCESQEQVPHDSDYVRAYCTYNCNGTQWTPRYKKVCREARQIINSHRRQIRDIARLIYVNDIALPHEINAIMPPIPLENCA